MSKLLRRMYQDPDEPAAVRELLGTAVRTSVDYDVKGGVARHLANVKAGTAAPDWATEFLAQQTAASGTTGVGLSTVVGWVVGSLVVGALVIGTVVYRSAEPDPITVVPGTTKAAPGTYAAEEDALGSAAVQAANERSRQLGLAAKRRRARIVARAEGRRRMADVIGSAQDEPRHAQLKGHHDGMTDDADHARSPRAASAPAGRAASKPANPGVAIQGHLGSTAADQSMSSPGAGVATVGSVSVSGDLADQAASSERAAVAVAAVAPAAAHEAAAVEVPDAPERAQRPVEQAREVVAPRKPDPEVDEARLEREMRMLKVAQANLVSNPERALRLAEQGEREFEGSLFTQERQHVLILALVQLGRVAEARRVAAGYLRRYPRGPYSDRVRRALAEGRVRR